MKHLSRNEVIKAIQNHAYSVIYIDAEWNGVRIPMQQIIDCTNDTSDIFFGYVDCDEETRYSSDIKLVNVPAVAYYRGEALVALVIGQSQDVSVNIEQLRRGYIPNM